VIHLPRRRARPRRGPRRPVGPRFEVVGRFRPFEVVSPGFVAVSEAQGRVDGLVRSAYSPPAPFTAVQAGVVPGCAVPVVAGLAADGAHLLAIHDPGTGRVGLELRAGGVTTVLGGTRVRGWVRRIAFVLCENQPTVLVDTGRGWRAVVTEKHRVAARVDFRVPATLAWFTVAWGAGAGTAGVGPVAAGPFGMAGLRDLHVVQHADGTPYVDDDGRSYLTATCAGLGFFTQAHWGVFAFHPDRVAEDGLEQTAHLYSRRDRLLLGDHAGQLVRDGDRWHVAVSSWGDFTPQRGVHVRHVTTTEDLLHGVHVLDTQRTPMPTGRGSYDPGMTRIGGRWHVSYVESVSHRPSRFHPALAVGPEAAEEAADDEPGHLTDGLVRAGEADDLDFCEGPVLARVDGRWRVLASDGKARRYPVFDLSMRRIGDLDAPYGSNLPHPNVVDLPDGGRLILTFDGTSHARRVLGYGTHGDVLVLRSGG
jgi:hypothetical protein